MELNVQILETAADKLGISLASFIKSNLIPKAGNWDAVLEKQPLVTKAMTQYESIRDADWKDYLQLFLKEVARLDLKYQKEIETLQQRTKALFLMCRGPQDDLIKVSEQLRPEFSEVYKIAFEIRGRASMNLAEGLQHVKSNIRIRSYYLSSHGMYLDEYLVNIMHSARAFTGTDAKDIAGEICRRYAALFYGSDLRVAHIQLLTAGASTVNWSQVGLGIWIGTAAMSVFWLLTSEYLEIKHNDSMLVLPSDCTAVRIFRVVGLCLLMHWGFGFQVAVWKESKVNAPVIFGVPGQFWPDSASVFTYCAKFTVFYVLFLLSFLKAFRGEFDINPSLFPIILLSTLLIVTIRFSARLIQVTSRKLGSSRSSMITSAMRETLLFVVGLSERSFLVTFLCDYLTSSSKILVDILYIVCELLSFSSDLVGTDGMCTNYPGIVFAVPLVMMWPLWLRTGQNLAQFYHKRTSWPYVPNALKYLLAHTIVIFTTLFPDLMQFENDESTLTWKIVFLVCFLMSTTLTFLWDVFMDWGLQFNGLRKRRMIPSDRFYYCCIVLDFFLRYFWAFTLAPTIRSSFLLSIRGFATGMEVIRRTFWGVIRVENEHLNNTREFRHVKFIPLYFCNKKDLSTPSTPAIEIIFEIFALLGAFLLITLLAILSK